MIKLHCTACGKELNWRQKAIPQKGIVMNLVEPHKCVIADESGLEAERDAEIADYDHTLGLADVELDIKNIPVPTIEKDEFELVDTEIGRLTSEKNIETEDLQKQLENFTEEPVDKVAEAFKQFPFVKKLNGGPDVEPLPVGDRRSKEHLRTEVQTSTAPTGLGDLAKGQVEAGMTTSEPGRELEDPDGENSPDK